jgi:hypothetical protein
VEEAMNYLNKFGEVYTLRDHKKENGIANLMSSLAGRPYYKGRVRIKFECELEWISGDYIVVRNSYSSLEATHKALRKYAKKSGFINWHEWISHIKGTPKILYLYHVVRILEVIN